MSTTSLKIPEELKRRTVDAAQQKGLSPHAFMVNAIEQTVLATEQRASGLGYAADDVHRYIKARIAGENPERPEARPWRG
jgi:predicted transcriptional regulator